MLVAFTFGWAIIYADRTSMYPLLSVIASQLGLTATQAGFLTSAYFLWYVFMQIPAGMAGDRFGLKKVLLFTNALVGIGILGLGLAGTSYIALITFAALHGLGAGAYYPSAYGTLLQIVPPQKRAFSSAILGIGMALGMLAGLAMSGPVYEWLQDYRAPFWLLSIPTFLMLVCFWRTVPDIKNTKAPAWQDYRQILADRQLWLINLSTFTAMYGFWVAVTWGPTFLKLERGFSLGQAGLYTGLVAITAVPGGLLWGRLADRIGRKPLALLLLPAAGLALLALSQARTAPAIISTLLLFGLFSNSALTPIMVAWTADIVSQRYPGLMGAAIGAFNCVIMSAAIVAPIVSGYLRDVTGSLVPAVIAGGVLVLAGSALLLFLPERPGNEYKHNYP